MGKLMKYQIDVLVDEIYKKNNESLEKFKTKDKFKEALKKIGDSKVYFNSKLLIKDFEDNKKAIEKFEDKVKDLKDLNDKIYKKQCELLNISPQHYNKQIKNSNEIDEIIKEDTLDSLNINIPTKREILSMVVINSSKDLPEIIKIVSEQFNNQLNGK